MRGKQIEGRRGLARTSHWVSTAGGNPRERGLRPLNSCRLAAPEESCINMKILVEEMNEDTSFKECDICD